MDDGANAGIRTARAKADRRMMTSAVTSVVTLVLLLVGSTWISSFVTGAREWRVLLPTAIVFVGFTPLMWRLGRQGRRQFFHVNGLVDERTRQLDGEARRRDFEAQVADALDMADTEPEALRVVERAFARVAPEQRVELLLADNSHAHLERKATASPDDEIAGCPVAAPFDCPAARRARVHRFDDPDALNICPKLVGRLRAGSTAVCLPVSLMGRAAGVIHTIGSTRTAAAPAVVAQLTSIAGQVGTRMAMLRVLAETQTQASTDSLTGLLNRRAFENDWQRDRASTSPSAVAMGDLDHFKALNDTFGHHTGDRALRVFADVLRSSLRQHDLVSRHGGEEFALFFPNCDAAGAVSRLQRVQNSLHGALATSGLPEFSASFGVVECTPDEELHSALGRADVALFAAKRAGRDRIVVHDRRGQDQLSPTPACADDARPAAQTTP